ncbi:MULTISPECIES: hypothetical protein [unclassified Micromonospora]|uniref:hypothetical protein n=1 Tax=unclassified Micromonospora TaxID=2617518 RepID=UPI00098D4BB0|nr:MULTISPECIES: hypothetical protein [unclassified Micromonospora]MDI5936782.1 hypothetical protein [Micromonospora sp. DH15]OON32800.1 hypothetical protein BSA16_03675 [Micromonospora sp. Rc5]
MSEETASGIAARCRANGGLTEATLGELRDELGYRKLGRWVLAEIAETLRTTGLGFFPPDRLRAELNTEPRQWQTVWIYDRDGGPRARMIDAVLQPDDCDVRGELEALGTKNLAGLTPRQKLERIRDIVNA